jgi:hypothetical protein
MILLSLSIAILFGISVFFFVIASMIIFVRLTRLGKHPKFSMLSVPGYVLWYCRNEGVSYNSELLKPLAVVRLSQLVVIVSAILFGLFMIPSHR